MVYGMIYRMPQTNLYADNGGLAHWQLYERKQHCIMETSSGNGKSVGGLPPQQKGLLRNHVSLQRLQKGSTMRTKAYITYSMSIVWFYCILSDCITLHNVVCLGMLSAVSRCVTISYHTVPIHIIPCHMIS